MPLVLASQFMEANHTMLTSELADVADAQPLPMSRIADLDFTMIKAKLMDADEGPGWTTQECELVEAEYRRFLALKHAYPDREIVPNRLVDLFWHQHILDTEKYAEDCAAVFSGFLHHYPYFGMQGDEDALHRAFEDTERLAQRHFGLPAPSDAAGMAKCRTKCKPMSCK